MANESRGPDAPDDAADPDEPDEPVRIPIEEVLDLHAFAPPDITSVVDEYVTAAAVDVLNGVAYDAAGDRLFVTNSQANTVTVLGRDHGMR